MNSKHLKNIVFAATLIVLFAPVDALSEVNLPTADSDGSMFKSDPNFTFGSDSQFETGGLFWRTMLALLLVVALGVALYYVSKKLGSKMVNLPGREMKIVETLYLGSRKTLHLIDIDGRRVLIGSTQASITRLSEWENDNDNSSVQQG